MKRPGLQVRSTEGYVAPRGRPQELRRPPPSAVLTATWDAVASAITTSGVPIRVSAAPFKGRKDKAATVADHVEVTRVEAQSRRAGRRLSRHPRGRVRRHRRKKKRWPIWRHRAALALKPETYERVSKGAIRCISQLPLPEGRYQLRASAGGAAMAGSVVYDFEVPDFRDDFSLSGVALTSKQASETFTFSPQGRIDVRFTGPPTTAREFSRDDTLTVFAEAYENRKKPHTVTLTIELRNEAGRVLGSYAIERKAVEKPKDAERLRVCAKPAARRFQPGPLRAFTSRRVRRWTRTRA